MKKSKVLNEVSEDQIDFAAKRLMEEIVAYRKIVNVTPIKCEPMTLNEASELCVVGETGAMVSNLLSLQEQADLKALQDWFEKNFSKILVLIIILIVPLIYYMIIK